MRGSENHNRKTDNLFLFCDGGDFFLGGGLSFKYQMNVFFLLCYVSNDTKMDDKMLIGQW